MNNKEFTCRMFALTILFFFCFSAFVSSQSMDQAQKDLTKARYIRYSQMDSSLFYFEKSRKEFLALGDTVMAIKCLLESSVVNTTKADYSKSYDGYWEVLSLAESIDAKELEASACDGLGTLYGLFYRHEKALAYYHQSLAIRKKLVEQGDIALTDLIGTYYLMAINYREQQKISTAQQYLDTCYQIRKAYPGKKVYIDAEQGYLYYYQNRFREAEQMLIEVEKSFTSANESYLVILYSFMGDLYNKMNDFDRSTHFYLKSLEAAKKYGSHQNYVPEVYKKLGDLYLSVNKSRQAYAFLTKSFNANDSLFGARSDNNRRFIEIKDQFRREQEEQQKLLEKARLNKLENEKRILFLRNSVLTIVLIFLVLISFFAFFYLKHRHKTAEQLLRSKQKAKEEKNKEVLEVKNKELTSSALQLIEKDELLIEIKNRLNAVKNKDLRDLIAKINANSKHDWKEFDTRFTAVNQDFYKSLSERFPDLTQRDHKLCALIKLNFSSKEMSLLLGISIESVHTSRYRLRQKLKLDKGENLTEFIAKV